MLHRVFVYQTILSKGTEREPTFLRFSGVSFANRRGQDVSSKSPLRRGLWSALPSAPLERCFSVRSLRLFVARRRFWSTGQTVGSTARRQVRVNAISIRNAFLRDRLNRKSAVFEISGGRTRTFEGFHASVCKFVPCAAARKRGGVQRRDHPDRVQPAGRGRHVGGRT